MRDFLPCTFVLDCLARETAEAHILDLSREFGRRANKKVRVSFVPEIRVADVCGCCRVWALTREVADACRHLRVRVVCHIPGETCLRQRSIERRIPKLCRDEELRAFVLIEEPMEGVGLLGRVHSSQQPRKPWNAARRGTPPLPATSGQGIAYWWHPQGAKRSPRSK